MLRIPVVTYNPYTYLEDVEKASKYQKWSQYKEFTDSTTIAQIYAIGKIFNSNKCFAVNIDRDDTLSNILGFKDEDSGVIYYCNMKRGGISYSLNKVLVDKNRNM